MPNPRNVLIVNTPPVESPGKYVIIVGGRGTSPTILFLDKLVGVEKLADGRFSAYEVRVGQKTIARFPSDVPYMMLVRDRTEMLTPAEAAEFHKKERESIAAVWGDEDTPPTTSIEELPADGHPIGQYL